MLSGPVGVPSPSGRGRVEPVLTGGMAWGDEAPSKPVYPGIDLIAAIAAGLKGLKGDPTSSPPLCGNP